MMRWEVDYERGLKMLPWLVLGCVGYSWLGYFFAGLVCSIGRLHGAVMLWYAGWMFSGDALMALGWFGLLWGSVYAVRKRLRRRW